MKHLFTCLIIVFTLFTQCFATEYFVNSVTGNDGNAGTSSGAAWQTLTPVQATAFQPGDIVNFACGSSWTKSDWVDYTDPPMWLIDDNGTASNPIIFRSYGTGPKPEFSYTFDKWRYPIRITADYVIIEGLHVTQGYSGFDIAVGADNNIIRNCEVSGCGHGFIAWGQYNKFTGNYIHDLVMVVNDRTRNNDYGCVSFWLHGPNNEIAYNLSVDNIQPSIDYTYDGGFLEFYDDCDNTYAHHNWVENGMGVVEGSNGHGHNVTIAYNVFIENKGMSAIHFTNFAITNFKFENNTYINRNGTLWDNLLGGVSLDMTVRNNIFVCGGSSSERISSSNSFNHSYNLYYLLDGATLGAVVLGPTEKLGNPLFVDEVNRNLRLQAGSLAINAGANLGYTADYEGNPVPNGAAPDMGAYEYTVLNVPEINIKQGAINIADNTGIYNFGGVTVGSYNIVTFTIENIGGVALNLTGSPRVNVAGTGFSLDTDAPVTVSANGAVTFKVKFEPASTGSFSGTISIANNDSNENPYNFEIIGTGLDNLVANSTFDVNTSGWALAFAGSGAATLASVVQTGYSGKAGKVTITNKGNTTSSVQLVYPIPVIAGKTYTVTFKASAAAARTMAIAFQQNVSPYTIYNTVTGISLTTTPTSYGPYTFDCVTTDATDMFKFLLGKNASAVFIDDVVITESNALKSAPVAKEAPGIAEAEGTEVTMYPNPVDGLLNINAPAKFNEKIAVSIVDLYGRVIASTNFVATSQGLNAFQLNTQAIAPGTYMVKVCSSTYTKTKTIVVKR